MEDDKTHLVDGKYGIRDLVDIEQLRIIFERFTELTGFTIGFLDHPGLNVLIATGWRDICTKFHRTCPSSLEKCTHSNSHLLDQLNTPDMITIEKCENGLVDCGMPIIIKGKHIASLATGQLLLEKPDLDRFRKQAKDFGFDEKKYLSALAEIPVVSSQKLMDVTRFLGNIAHMLSEQGYTQLISKEKTESLKKEIDERKKAEEKLADERERLMVTLKSIGDGVITTDAKGNLVLMNNAAEKLTGYSLSESIGRPLPEIFNIINAETRKPCENPVEKVLTQNQTIRLENHTILINSDGTERIIVDSGAPIRDFAGNIIGVVLVFRDDTDRQKTEQMLQNVQKLEALNLLASGIAHDFNNYLAGILMSIELTLDLLKAGNSPQATLELTGLLEVIDKAKSLARQLLTFSKREIPELKPGIIEKLVRNMANFFISGSDISVNFHSDPKLPDCVFDSNQISQVIQNLVINAKEAMDGTGTIEISLGTEDIGDTHSTLEPGQYVKISVRDQGSGIPDSLIPCIFDPFFTTKPSGSGLGLAICYSILKKHGGHIEVESKLGKGSVFSIYLPAVKP